MLSIEELNNFKNRNDFVNLLKKKLPKKKFEKIIAKSRITFEPNEKLQVVDGFGAGIKRRTVTIVFFYFVINSTSTIWIAVFI